jgi:hypothetical protein
LSTVNVVNRYVNFFLRVCVGCMVINNPKYDLLQTIRNRKEDVTL